MNLILTSHGSLCEGLLDAFGMMVSNSCTVTAVSLNDKGIDDFRQRLEDTVSEHLATGNVFIMSDLYGGTPYNESYALYLRHPEGIRVVAGANFPMLLEVGIAAADCDDLDELVTAAIEAGRGGVVAAEAADDTQTNEDDLF